MEADSRLMEYVSTLPHANVESALQDPKFDLSQARNPSAYLMGLLKRKASGDARDNDGEGYEGGRARGGKKLKAQAAKKEERLKAAAAAPATVSAVAPQREPAAGAASGHYLTANCSRQKARGGSDSKKRREEARKLKREQWENSHAAV
jgi:hypothetical protein